MKKIKTFIIIDSVPLDKPNWLEPSLNYFDYYQPKKNLHEEHKNKVFR